MLEIKNLHKSFKSLTVLNGIDLSVKEGELIYIHGINGCGKSTLFKIVCDIIEADEGTVTKESRVKLGALIENPGFSEFDTLKKNLKYLAELTGTYDEVKAMELCKLLNLDYKNRNVMHSYSVGMRQKAGIIQSMMEGQNLILLDEPTRGLDKESVKNFYTLIQSLINENKTVIIASHEPLEMLTFTASYLLEDGVLIKEEV